MAENAYIKRKFSNFRGVFSVHDGVALDYIGSLRQKNYSEATLTVRCRGVREFFSFLENAGVGRLQQVDGELLRRYRGHLAGRGFSACTVESYLYTLKQFFAFLEEQGTVFIDPARDLAVPRPERRLGYVPDVAEMKRLLAAPDISTDLGLRDRALLETAYSTGARLGELEHLDIFSPDLSHGSLKLSGKGRKDRVVPLGALVASWLEKYLVQVRPGLLKGNPDEQALWIGRGGRKMTRAAIEGVFCRYAGRAGLRRISPHAVRRACATHMLANGAHPMAIKMLLGHATMKTLGQYLCLTITELKAMHRRSRPGK